MFEDIGIDIDKRILPNVSVKYHTDKDLAYDTVSPYLSANLMWTTLQTQLKKKVWKKAALIRFLWRASTWHQNNLSSESSSCCDTTTMVKPEVGPRTPKTWI